MTAMASEGKPAPPSAASKPKKRKYLPYGKPVNKGSRPLRPGVQGFFITCDGGRERQAAHEAINLLENFYEELVDGRSSRPKENSVPPRPVNKITKFDDSDSSDDDCNPTDTNDRPHGSQEDNEEDQCAKKQKTGSVVPKSETGHTNGNDLVHPVQENEIDDSSAKKVDKDLHTRKEESSHTVKEKSVDDLIEEELKELGDKNKRRFMSLDSGCNGVIFIQMQRKDGDPNPASIVEHMLNFAASTRKPMSRFLLRILPIEVACYASVEEISNAMKPLITIHFPADAPTVSKFAVLYDARANTGIDRMAIINAVAKSVPHPHKVDLNNPEKSIIVQIVKTVCLVGVVKRYKELCKYNLRQLTTPPVDQTS